MKLNVRKILEEFLMYGVPIIVVALMVSTIHFLAPLHASSSARQLTGGQPYIYYSRHILYDNGTLVLYYNSVGAQIIGVRLISAIDNSRKEYSLLGELHSNKVIVDLPSDLMKYLCTSGDSLKVNVSLIIRAYNTTAMFYSYPIIVKYICKIKFNVVDRGNAIVINGSSYRWLLDEGLDINVTVNLYKTKPVLRLMYTNTTHLKYYGFPITLSVPDHDYGYVIIKYRINGRVVRNGFYIEPSR